MEPLWNVREMSAATKMCERSIKDRCSARWCARHGVKPMPHLRIANRLRFVPAQVEAYLQQQFQNAKSANSEWWDGKDAAKTKA